jgi:N-acetyl sugar amidotransferase
MKYCKKCLMPDTRPGLKFDDHGICYACLHFDQQKETNWKNRWLELKKICDKYRGCNGDGYDCAMAVSGGKDSHFQVYVMKEKLKMNPLLLSVGNLDWTEIGRSNLNNISETFGCDMLMFQPNRKIAKIMMKKAFEKLGSPSWYLDYLIYAYPYKMAIKMGLKLLVYGEDVNYTYGGEHGKETPSAMLQPLNDVAKQVWDEWFVDEEINKKDLISIKQPSIDECKTFGLEPIYLSYFVPWNTHHNYEVATRWGFQHLEHEYQREGFIENYDQIDTLSYLVNIFMKYPKYGHAYSTDMASRWIRYGMKTRDEMIPLVEENDGQLDQGTLKKFCEFIDISVPQFWKIIDKWYNPDLFEKTRDELWKPKFKVGKGIET